MKKNTKKLIKVLNFCLPIIIYIACSAFAFLLWNLFNFGAAPIISTSIILCIAGSLLTGFFARSKEGKKGMYVAIAVAVIGAVLWIFAYAYNSSEIAYAATALSSYYFNIQSCLPYDTSEILLYIGYGIAIIVPVGFIILGRFLRVKILKGKA